MSLLIAVEKTMPKRGIIQLVVGKARPAGSGEGDRQGHGLDWESFEAAMGEWVANFGRDIPYWSPVKKAMETRFCGIWDSHKQPIASDLIAAWPFEDEQLYRVQVRPHDPSYVAKAVSGQIPGSSWAGTALAEEVDE